MQSCCILDEMGYLLKHDFLKNNFQSDDIHGNYIPTGPAAT